MSVATAVLERLTVPDYWLMARVERWRPPRYLRRWMLVASRAGDGFLWYLAGLIVLWQGGTRRWPAFDAAALAAGLGIAAFESLKHGCRRSRPRLRLACGAKPPRAPDRYSFPSGHTLTAFAVSTALFYSYPRLEPLLLFLAVNIALSRILLGLHFLSDVIASTALGWTFGYIAAAWLLHPR